MPDADPCQQYMMLLSAYHDGELPEDQHHQLAGHLAQCEHCRAQVEQVQQISRDFQNHTSALRLPEDRVAAICEASSLQSRTIIRTASGWGLAAAVVMLASITWLVADASSSGTPPANWERLAVLQEASPGEVSGRVDADLQLAMLLLDGTFDREVIDHD